MTAPGGSSRVLSSEQRQYFGRTGMPLGAPIGVRATWTTPVLDMRLVMDSVLAGESARVRVSFVPLALLWPIGIGLMVVAGAGLMATRPHSATVVPTFAPVEREKLERVTQRITTA